MPKAAQRILDPATVARLSRLRLGLRRRVQGRYAGAHAATGYGSSLDFADYREYVAGDDPRRVDPHAQARLGRLLVKLYEAEDEAALRVVVDLSGSMAFGRKAAAAREVAAALVSVAVAGGDRVRVLTAATAFEAGPWYRGAAALPAVESRLVAVTAGGAPNLVDALRRAHREGPRGPVVLVSDLLESSWPDVVRALGGGRSDSCLVHLVGRDDLEPRLDGDARLVDAETAAEIEAGAGEESLAAYARARDEWLGDVRRACGAVAVAYAPLVDDESVERLVTVSLAGLGIVA